MSDKKQYDRIEVAGLVAVVMVLIAAVVAMFSDFGASLFNSSLEYDSSSYYSQGLIFESKGDYTQAIASYQSEIETNPENPAAYNSLAWLYVDKMQANYQEAVALAQTAVTLAEQGEKKTNKRELANYLDTLGWAYYKIGDYQQAANVLQRAVSLDDRKSLQGHLQAAQDALDSVP